jgi:tRNA 2-thiouridine synthesizing protein A
MPTGSPDESKDGAARVAVGLWLDERGQRCPLPVIALNRAAQAAPPGQVIGVLADDPAAAYDIPAWCRLKGFTFVGDEPPPDEGAGRAYLVALRPAG